MQVEYVRISDLIGRPAVSQIQAAENRASGRGPQIAQPPQRGLIPIGRTTFYQLIKSGRIPKPTKIGRVSVWRLSEVRAGIDAVRDHA